MPSSGFTLDLEPHVGEADPPRVMLKEVTRTKVGREVRVLPFCGEQGLHCIMLSAPLVVFFVGSTMFPFRKEGLPWTACYRFQRACG